MRGWSSVVVQLVEQSASDAEFKGLMPTVSCTGRTLGKTEYKRMARGDGMVGRMIAQ